MTAGSARSEALRPLRASQNAGATSIAQRGALQQPQVVPKLARLSPPPATLLGCGSSSLTRRRTARCVTRANDDFPERPLTLGRLALLPKRERS